MDSLSTTDTDAPIMHSEPSTRSHSTDVLMITYNRPEYTRRSLTRLLSTCDEATRVWIWHNGNHEETLELVRSYESHPCVERLYHSPENKRLRVPTNWLWENATGDFLSKVDDDCLVEPGWLQKLANAHQNHPALGVLGSWRYLDDEYLPEVSEPKMKDLGGGERVLQNLWVQGSGYLMKRQCFLDQGPIPPGQNFTRYCIRLAERGYVNGWYVPFIREEHMDDPRSPYNCLLSDADLMKNLPLSAATNAVQTLAGWDAQLRRSAVRAQSASLDTRQYRGWRLKRRNLLRRTQRWRERWAGNQGTCDEIC